MADSIASAWVEVLPDFQNFRKTANSEITDTLGSAGNSGGNAFGSSFKGSVGSIFSGAFLANIATDFARGIGELIGTTISSSIGYALDGVKLASNLSETRSAIQQVFGGSSADIEKFASTANAALGQTQQQALDAAQNFGVFAQSAGLTGAPLTSFSTGLVTLATDLASFYNTDPQQAIDALGAGLRGESEPLRKYGVLLDDASLRAQAMKLGIYDGNGALTSQQRILAAQAEIFDQTGIAQGDFAKTSDGLAGQQKILSASFEDAQTSLGTALLPAMTDLATFANTTLVPMLNTLVEQIGPILTTALADSGPAFEDMITSIVPLIPELVKLAVEAIPPLLQILTLMAPVLIEIAKANAGFLAGLSGLFSFISGDITLAQLGQKIQEIGGVFAVVGTAIGQFGVTLGQFVVDTGQKVQEFVSFWAAVPGQIVGALGNLGNLLVSSGRALIQGFIDGIGDMIGAVGNAVGGVLDFVAGFFPHSPAERGPFSGSGWAAVRSAGVALGDQFSLGLADSGSPLGGAFAVQSFGTGPVSVGSTDQTVRDIHFHTEDPIVAYQMMKNELGGKLAI